MYDGMMYAVYAVTLVLHRALGHTRRYVVYTNNRRNSETSAKKIVVP